MRIKYYETAWKDISNSPGWFGKICLLALVNFIPIFGQIVTFGYLYGWAREIAWGVHAPMPQKLFNNDDGKFWRRGWFVFVLVVVFALIPSIISTAGQIMQGTGYSAIRVGEHGASGSVLGTIGLLVYFIGVVASVFAGILAWIGSMRIAVYDRLSAGFQLGKIWKMFRHDTGGIMRIFGMDLLVGLILGVILSIVITMLMMVVMFAGVAGLVGAGYSADSVQYMTDAQAARMAVQFMASAGIVGIICFLIMIFACLMATVFIDMLVFRAVGYWTYQFDVPRWRGQDEPMPFEMGMGAGVASPMSQPPMYAAPQQAPGPEVAPMAGGVVDPSAPNAVAQNASGVPGAAAPGVSVAPNAAAPGVAASGMPGVPSALDAATVVSVPIASQGYAPGEASGDMPAAGSPVPDSPFVSVSQPAVQAEDFGYASGPQTSPQVARTVAEAPVITAQPAVGQIAPPPSESPDPLQGAMSFVEEAFQSEGVQPEGVQPESIQPTADAGAASSESDQTPPNNN